MAHTAARRDITSITGDSYDRDLSPSQNEGTPYPYVPGRERANAPPHTNSMPVAAPPPGPHYTNCAPQWGAPPTSYPSIQEQHYWDGAPYRLWPNAQHDGPFTAPAMNVDVPYMHHNQNAGSVNGATVPIVDGPHGRHPTATNLRPAYATEFGSTLGTASAPSAAGADAHGQPNYSPTAGAEAPSMPSESLNFFARRYVLDPGTRVDAILMGTSGYGRLKIVLTLEVADSGV